MDNLNLGCQYYMALQYHMEEALLEKGMNSNNATREPPYAIFSEKYYDDINKLNHHVILKMQEKNNMS